VSIISSLDPKTLSEKRTSPDLRRLLVEAIKIFAASRASFFESALFFMTGNAGDFDVGLISPCFFKVFTGLQAGKTALKWRTGVTQPAYYIA
jgi:hypothetical protein